MPQCKTCKYPMKNGLSDSHHNHLASLQAGRAIAALLVVFYHNALYIFALDKYWGYDPSVGLFNFGHAGVEFFFVLSGFIILHIHWNDLNRPSQFFTFVRKRCIRIYPVYWLVLVAIIPIYFLLPSFGYPYHRDINTIFSSILLVYFDENLHTEIAVAWTLYHEILFYFIFSLIILNKRFGLLILTGWMLASMSTFLIEMPSFFSEYLMSPLHLLFGMGMIACWSLQNYKITAPLAVSRAGILLFIAAGLEEDFAGWLSVDVRNLFYGLGSAATLIGWVELERQGRLRVPAWLQLIGNASYAIYLTHFTLLSFLAKLFIYFGARETLPILLSFIILPMLAVLLGIAAHISIERPLLRKLQHSLKPVAAPQFANTSVRRTGNVST